MTNKEKLLAAEMLNMLSDMLANCGCNDFDFPDSWTEDDKKSFVLGFSTWNGAPENYDKDNLNLADFSVASYLAKMLNLECG